MDLEDQGDTRTEQIRNTNFRELLKNALDVEQALRHYLEAAPVLGHPLY